MTTRRSSAALQIRDEIVAPPAKRACDDRTFELPTVVYLASAVLFLGFVSVLSLAAANAELAVPYAVFVTFIFAFFLVPSLWTRMVPGENSSHTLSWSELMEKGVAIEHGCCSGREAATLVLLLPFLIFCWSIAVAIIIALT